MIYVRNTQYKLAIQKLIHKYNKLPWYKKFLFKLFSYRLSSTLSQINLETPSVTQVQALHNISMNAWFFSNIFDSLPNLKALF